MAEKGKEKEAIESNEKATPKHEATATTAVAEAPITPEPKRKKEKRERPPRIVPEIPPFELSTTLDLGRDYDRVIKQGFGEITGSIAEQIEQVLSIPEDTAPKLRRELERIRKNAAKAFAKATKTFGTRLLASDQIRFRELRPGSNSGHVQFGPQALHFSPANISRYLGQFRNLEALIAGENPPLQRFPNLPATLTASYGTSLENDYFLSGTVEFTPNFAQPADSTLAFSMELFAKRGKSLGMRLQFKVKHYFHPDNFSNEATLEIPLTGKK
ncbi:MAG: hypothetical protein AAF998_04125 [Bacteroidota bacterium]